MPAVDPVVRATVVEVRAQVPDQLGRVAADPGDEVRPAPAQERQPEQVETGHGADAAVVHDPAPPVERRRDRATGTSAGSPVAQITVAKRPRSSSVGTSPSRVGGGRVGGADIAVEAAARRRTRRCRSSSRVLLQVGVGHEAAPARRSTAPCPRRRASAGRPRRRRRRRSALRSSVRALGAADELQRRHAAGPARRRRPRRSARRAGRSRPSTSRCRARGTCAGGERARRRRSSTSRPLRRSSSAICTPDADAPTTSTSPARRAAPGRRYSSAVSWSIRRRQIGRRPRARAARSTRRSPRRRRRTASGPRSVTTSKPAARPPHLRDGRRGCRTGAVEPVAVAVEERDDLAARHEAVGIVAVVAVTGQRGSSSSGSAGGASPTARVRHEFATSPRSRTTWSIAGAAR